MRFSAGVSQLFLQLVVAMYDHAVTETAQQTETVEQPPDHELRTSSVLTSDILALVLPPPDQFADPIEYPDHADQFAGSKEFEEPNPADQFVDTEEAEKSDPVHQLADAVELDKPNPVGQFLDTADLEDNRTTKQRTVHSSTKPPEANHANPAKKQSEQQDNHGPDALKSKTTLNKEQKIASTQNRYSDLTIAVQINGRNTSCLVVTGTAVSILDATHMLELFDGQLPPLSRSSSRVLKTVSGEDLTVCVILRTFVSIAGGTYPCEFKVVEGVTYRSVLGRDFLRDHQAHIDFENHTIKLKDRSPVTFSEDVLAVIAQATYVIPPLSETIISAKIKGNASPGTIRLIESAPRLIEHYHLQRAAALVKVTDNEAVPFCLINPTRLLVTLRKGATLGTFSEADGDPDVCPVEDTSTRQNPLQQSGSFPVDLQGSA